MNREHYREHRFLNNIHSLVQIGAMLALLVGVGWLLFGSDLVWWIGSAVVVMMLFASKLDPFSVLRMFRARHIQPHEAPALYQMVQHLAQRAGLERMPALFLIPNGQANAFTVGDRNRAAIAMTHGLLNQMHQRELMGVLAHEVSHIANNDTRAMFLVGLTSRLTHSLSMMGYILLFLNIPFLWSGEASISLLAIALLIAAPHFSQLLQMAFSRTREFRADMDAAYLTGDPMGLASALAKIERQDTSIWARIFAPYMRRSTPTPHDSHPPTRERIRRLNSLTLRAA
ncbi:MAG: M48 family metalloprotease [Acidobacteria bacterium]|nr:M48 family metalloprotease [Acidobacteriota bacterium]